MRKTGGRASQLKAENALAPDRRLCFTQYARVTAAVDRFQQVGISLQRTGRHMLQNRVRPGCQELNSERGSADGRLRTKLRDKRSAAALRAAAVHLNLHTFTALGPVGESESDYGEDSGN